MNPEQFYAFRLERLDSYKVEFSCYGLAILLVTLIECILNSFTPLGHSRYGEVDENFSGNSFQIACETSKDRDSGPRPPYSLNLNLGGDRFAGLYIRQRRFTKSAIFVPVFSHLPNVLPFSNVFL